MKMRKWVASFLVVALCISMIQVPLYSIEVTKGLEESFEKDLSQWSQKKSGGGPLPEFAFIQEGERSVLKATMIESLGYIESVKIPVAYGDQLDLNVVLKNELVENIDPSKEGVFFRINQFESSTSSPMNDERLELIKVSGSEDWRTETRSFEITNPSVNYISVQVVFGWWTTSKVNGTLYIDHMDLTHKEKPVQEIEDGLLVNPKFEEGLNQWRLIANGGNMPITTEFESPEFQGGKAIEFELEDVSAYMMSEKIPVEKGEKYVVNIKHMQDSLENVNTSRAAIYIRASYYDDSTSSPVEQIELNTYNGSSDWAVDQYAFSVDEDAYKYVSIHVVFGWWTNSEANGTYWLDYIQLLKEETDDSTDPENPEEPDIQQDDVAYNGNFSLTKNTEEAYWVNGTKPNGWRYQYRPEFASEESKNPEINVSGSGTIDMVLDSAVSWIEPETEYRIPIVNGKEYEVKTFIKGELETSHTSQVPTFLRVELVDSQGNYINGTRATLDSLNNGTYSEWTELSGKYIVNNVDATHLKVVVFFGQWGNGNGATGNASIQQIQVFVDRVPLESVDIKQDSVTIRKGKETTLNYSVYPEDANNQQVQWRSSDDTIVSIDGNGAITGKNAGTAVITLQSLEDETIVDRCEVTIVDGYIPVSDVKIDRESLILEMGLGRQLSATAYPDYASNKQIVWSVADESIASIDQGFVKGLAVGTTKVIAKSLDQENIYNELKLEIIAKTDDNYDRLRKKWFDSIVGGANADLTDASTQVLIGNIEEAGYEAWDSMDTENAFYLWENNSDFSASSTVTQNFNNLKQMAKAYVITGSSLKGNSELLQDIVYGLEWMNKNHYKPDVWYGNWWDWEIGSPQHIVDTLMLIYDDVNPSLIEAYVKSIDWYVPDPRYFSKKWHVLSTGANRSDLCLVVLGSGILDKEESKIIDASNSLEVVYEYVESGDGFYEDGSFVQHYHVPYTGTYGSILFSGIGRIFNILNDSPWEKESESVNNVYDMLLKGVQPLIYKGMMMDMVSGRSIARQDIGERKHGIGMIKRMIEYSAFAPEPYASEIKSMVKYWIESNTYLDFLNNANDLNILLQAQDVLNDSNVNSRGPLVGNYVFTDMDRVVHRNTSYAAGISMYSNKISNYESLNEENLHGWHLGDGLLYLYHDDLGHFTEDYWPTVDPYRLPGITVDTKILDNAEGERRKSRESFVGGVTLDGTYGVAAMQLNKDNDQVDMDLRGKKAWFFFDNEIVALGSDIYSSKGRTIETIVENRKISDAATETLSINGEIINRDGVIHEKEANWAYLSSGIGYYFPKGQKLNVLLEQREGRWSDINGATRFLDGDEAVSGNYVTLWKDHGIDPTKDQYSYVLLPSMNDSADVEKYYKNPEIKIIHNNEKVQIVKETSTGLTGYVFWEASELDEEDLMIESISHPGIVMTEQNKDKWIVSYADPTQKLQDEVQIVLKTQDVTLANKNEAISVVEAEQYTYIHINLDAVEGETQEVVFTVDKEDPDKEDPDKEDPDKEDPDKEDSDKKKKKDDKKKVVEKIELPMEQFADKRWAQEPLVALNELGFLRQLEEIEFGIPISRKAIFSIFSQINEAYDIDVQIEPNTDEGVQHNEDIVKRQEIILIIDAYFNDTLSDEAVNKILSDFEDEEMIDESVRMNFALLKDKGILKGNLNYGKLYANPMDVLTLEEAATFIHRMIEELSK